MNANPRKPGVLAPAQLEQLRALSTCVVASAIEVFDVRLPNTGFLDASVRCIFEDRPPVAGYAATARIRTATPPMEGGWFSYARTDWWDHLLAIPAPRVLVIQDTDHKPGVGAFVGEVHANILLALGCVAVVTNGAVRDLREVKPTGFQMFAGNVAVSHAYAHVFDFGGSVEIGGMRIQPGDLVHGDWNGVQTVPPDINVDQVLAAAEEIIQRRRSIVQKCSPSGFGLDKLRESVKASTKPIAK